MRSPGPGKNKILEPLSNRDRYHALSPGRLNWLLIACAHLIFSFSSVHAVAPDSPNWKWSLPQPHGNNIFDVVEFNGGLVQLCDSGRMYFSTDGENWVRVETGTALSLRSATIFKDTLLVGTADGHILRTQDLESFELISLNSSAWVEGMASSSFLAVAAGDEGNIWSSSDGVVWSPVNSITQEWLRGLHFTGSQFIAVGENGTLITSFNGTTWTPRLVPTTNHLNRLNSSSSKIIAVGDSGTILVSSNGVNWNTEAAPVTDNLYSVSLDDANNEFIGGQSAGLIRNGAGNWELAPASLPSWVWLANTVWNSSIYFFGRTGLIYSKPLSGESDWEAGDDSPRNWIWDLTIVEDEMFAAGDLGTILTSQRGIRWESVPVPNTATNSFLMGIAGDASGMVAVGTEGAILFSSPTTTELLTTNIMDGMESVTTNSVTLNGIEWEDVRPSGFQSNLQGLTQFGDSYIACGESGLILNSPDGRVWTQNQTSRTSFLSSIATDGDFAVVCGSEGTLGYSSDGETWHFLTPFTSDWLVRCRFLEGQFYVSGQNGMMARSTDGINWTQISTPTADEWIHDIHFTNGHYYAVGTGGTFLTSPDGTTWVEINVPTGKSLYCLNSRPRRLLAAGIEGVVLRALTASLDDPIVFGPSEVIQTESIQAIGLSLSGTTDQFFQIENSDDLITWEPVIVDEITDPDGLYILLWEILQPSAPSTTTPNHLFFRATPISTDL